MTNAPPFLLCWLLMCSDMAIRAGTASRLGPDDYDKHAGVLRFRTKYGATQELPVTAELRRLLDTCEERSLPFVSQLPRSTYMRAGRPVQQSPALKPLHANSLRRTYRQLCLRHGITRQLNPHDLRRTTVRKVYRETRDLLLAQALLGHSDLSSTLWYLQGEVSEVTVGPLELAKLNPLVEVSQ